MCMVIQIRLVSATNRICTAMHICARNKFNNFQVQAIPVHTVLLFDFKGPVMILEKFCKSQCEQHKLGRYRKFSNSRFAEEIYCNSVQICLV